MASPSSSALQRSIASPKIYDVFISHRGPDVKETFAKKLYERLQKRGCRAFLDRKELEGGDSIPSAIHHAICSSRVQIAIFSKGFAQSSWCLDELVLMLQQRETLFIPVFYGVEPWELRHIDNEKSHYATAFSDYERKGRNLEKLDEWKNGLVSASYISGYVLSQHENNLCDEIVSRVEKEMQKWIPLHVAKYPVGLAELVQDFERFCTSNRARDKATIVGIFGLGGAGKTTLAKEFFNRKRSSYSASCFLSDVRESHNRHDLHSLQSKLLDNLFGEKLTNVNDEIALLRYRLGRARHLQFIIVLDDIDHQEQLDALLPEESLSAGSLVIITTRDRSMLRVTDASSRYRMEGMDKDNSKELFCSHAFRGKNPPNSIAYEKLTDSFVKFCGGLPLSLKVLGAHLYGRTEAYWELELKKVKLIPHKDIMESLKISFDGLDSQERQIFIDIACFFNKPGTVGVKEKAVAIWNAVGCSAENAVQTLEEKCLVEINVCDSFEMHDHLRDLGRQMADKLVPPRLWQPDRLKSMEAKGFEQILAETNRRCFHSFEDSSLKTRFTYFIASLNDSAEAELLLLEIDNYLGNLINIPPWIPLRKLRSLTVRNMEEIWSTFQQQLQPNSQASLELRVLMIFNSPSQNLPDLIGMCSHLEVLYVSCSLENTDVTSFVKSLKRLRNLKSLELWFWDTVFFSGNLDLSKGGDSSNFEARMDSLETIVFRRLDNISKLVISGEISPRLESLEVMHMPNLNEMDLEQLRRLYKLEVCGCDNLETLSGLKELEKLKTLIVKQCFRLEMISGLSCATELRELHTESCDGLKSLPNLSDLRHLERITIVECQQLQSVEGVEELQELKSLVIGAHVNGDPTVFNCIHGLTRLPSEFAILTGKALEKTSSRLNADLINEVIGAEAVVEIEIEGKTEGLTMRSSSSGITIYALLVTSERGFQVHACQNSLVSFLQFRDGVFMITVLLTSGKITVTTTHSAGILGGFKAVVDEGEEGRALIVLKRIVDSLYGRSMEPMLSSCDVAGGSGSTM